MIIQKVDSVAAGALGTKEGDYRGRRVTMISAWGVEGQPPPAIESPGSQTPAEIPRGDRGVHQMEITGASRAASSPSQPSAVPQPPRWGISASFAPVSRHSCAA